MSDLTPTRSRPGTVTAVAVLFVLGALVQFFTSIVCVVLVFRPGDVQQFFGAPVSDWYWILTATLSFILALIYLWVAQQQLAGSPEAWLLVNILAIINIIFAFFQIASGTGWVALAVNAIALILNNTAASRNYFGTVGGFGPQPPGVA